MRMRRKGATPGRSAGRTAAEARSAPSRGIGWPFAATLTASLVTVLALSGGIGYAASGSKAAIKVVKRAVGPAKKHSSELPVVRNSAATHQYKVKCNSGRGNWSEYPPNTRDRTSSSTLVDPHAGGRGPGPYPTDDCDPGNSGAKNRGGD